MNITDRQEEQFNKYYELLMEWNGKINLTAITDRDEVWIKHFEDSLSIERIMDLDKVQSVIDVGTGAGFPGIPIKIMYPHIKLTLLDSLDKRIRFLDEVTEKLKLDEVQKVHGRAEDIARLAEYREQYDLCVSRAVAKLSVLTELCTPYVKTGGHFVAYKSEKAGDELKEADAAIKKLGCRTAIVDEFTLSDAGYYRTLISMEKIIPTDEKYPRRAGIPAKKPLT